MGFTEGAIMIGAALVMIFIGRPEGPLGRFLSVYIVGQLYVMSAMVLGVIGAALMIVTWPF
ncbi:MAG TPA: hypothetical protein VKT73_08005 [Xanthobacteraceae bacterium]|nr:hypothetical protein [Xanthobacteraceae bacterium]